MVETKERVARKPTREPTKQISEVQTSLCIPSTIISKSNATSLEQITHIAYQVAKCATVYNVAEIVVLNVPSSSEREKIEEAKRLKAVTIDGDAGNKKIKFNLEAEVPQQDDQSPEAEGASKLNDSKNDALLFATLLQYFVTPKYLVKSVFENNVFKNKFKYAEKLPKLSTLPFMNNNNVGKYFKEGLTIAKHTPKVQKKGKKVSALKKLSVTKYVNIGEEKPLELNGIEVPVNVRVTIDVRNKSVVSPRDAYGVSGCKAAFGYHVRLAQSITAVFTESSFPEGYTESLFVNADNYFKEQSGADLAKIEKATKGEVLFVLGKMSDYKYVFEQENIEGIQDVSEMFDGELPVPSGLRIEDAALVALTKAL